MPNKIKLNLEDLKVESFITTLSDEEKDNLKGGTSQGSMPGCSLLRVQCIAASETGCN
jgi:hypothetical protein